MPVSNHLTGVTEVVGSVSVWNSENFFSSSFICFQATNTYKITNNFVNSDPFANKPLFNITGSFEKEPRAYTEWPGAGNDMSQQNVNFLLCELCLDMHLFKVWLPQFWQSITKFAE